MSANPLLEINPTQASQSANPLLDISPTQNAVQSANQAAAPFADPFLAGAGQQLAKTGQNLADIPASGLDALGITQNGRQGIDQAFNNIVYPSYAPTMAQNPNAALGGQVAGAIIGSAPSLVSSPLKTVQAATGFANGYLNSDPNAPLVEKAINGAGGAALNMLPAGAALSTVGGAGLGYGYGLATGGDAGKDALYGGAAGLTAYAGGKGIVNMLRGARATVMGATDIANQATQKTLEATGKDLGTATPEDFFNARDKVLNAAKVVKNERYTARDDLADSLGVNVNLSPVKDDIDFYLNNAKVTRTREGDQIIQQVKNDKPLSYSQAQTLSDLAGESATSAARQGDQVLSRSLMNVKNSIDSHIGNVSDMSGGLLSSLHNEADAFYKNVYAPLANTVDKQAEAQRFSEGKLINNALKSIMQDKSAYDAMGAANQYGIQNNLQDVMRAAFVNAEKEGATIKTASGEVVDPKAFGNSIAKGLQNNPVPLEPITSKLQALGDALDVAKKVNQIRNIGTEHSLGQKVLVGLASSAVGGGATYYGSGGNLGASATAAAGSFFIPKALYMYSAGRMLQNPTTRALLSRAATLSDQAPPETKAAISTLIAKKFQDQVKTIPSRLLPVFTNSSQQQQNTQ